MVQRGHRRVANVFSHARTCRYGPFQQPRLTAGVCQFFLPFRPLANRGNPSAQLFSPPPAAVVGQLHMKKSPQEQG